MDRRVSWFFGLALGLFGVVAPAAFAQDRPMIPMRVDNVGLPPVAAPGPPLVINDAPPAEVVISPNTGMARLGTPTGLSIIPLSDLALKSSEYMDPRYIENSAHPDDPGLWERFRTHYGDQTHRLLDDYVHFYLGENIVYLGAAVAVAAPLANTRADQEIRNWYQQQAPQGRSRGIDNTAIFFNNFGNYKYTLPGLLALSGTGFLFPEHEMLAALGEFGDRSIRALAVGAPAVGILQYGLGSDRPFTQDSAWHPFRSDHGVSGNAFVGAVPFLTAASMTDSRALQALLIAGSLAPSWSRMHTDDHYFSQVLLGWSIAYLSVRSVNQTEESSRFHIVPCDIPKGVGMGVMMQY